MSKSPKNREKIFFALCHRSVRQARTSGKGVWGVQTPPEPKNCLKNSNTLRFKPPDLVVYCLSLLIQISVIFWRFSIFLRCFFMKKSNFFQKFYGKTLNIFLTPTSCLYFVVVIYMCPILWRSFDLQSQSHDKRKNGVFWFYNRPAPPQNIGLGTPPMYVTWNKSF